MDILGDWSDNPDNYKISYGKPLPPLKPEPKARQEHTFKIGDIAQITESNWDFRVGRYIKITQRGHSRSVVYFEYLEEDVELAKQEQNNNTELSIGTRKLRFVA